MPFISTQEVKEIRTQLKAQLPEFKFSVTKCHHSEVSVSIMAGPVEFDKAHFQVNHFWIDSNYANQPEIRDLFNKIMGIIRGSKGQRIIVEDGDYGSIPNYYISLNVGKWDKPYSKAA